MRLTDLRAVLADIEANIDEGERIEITAILQSGLELSGTYQLLKNAGLSGSGTILVLSQTDRPPWYVDPTAIGAITLAQPHRTSSKR